MTKQIKDLKLNESFYYVDKETFQIIHYEYIYHYIDKTTKRGYYLFKEKRYDKLVDFSSLETKDILYDSFETYSDAILYLKYLLESYLKQINSRIFQSV